MSISVLGAGAFGTALAISLAQKSQVTLWCRNKEHALEMQSARANTRRLPGAIFPEQLKVTSELSHLGESETLLLAVPMQQLRDFLKVTELDFAHKTLVACCKGIEISSGVGPVSVINEEHPSAVASLLTGPSFATDIARGLPTALTIACADEAKVRNLQRTLSTPTLRLYRTTDVVGAEIGGALKNVFAIACGVVHGARLGDSARAALMTRGYAEMQRFALAQGALPQTLSGLSGFGDLSLTCSSTQSRNFRLGESLGRGETFDPKITVEGVATARAVVKVAETPRIDMPISRAVTNLIGRNLTIHEAVEQLLTRPLKEE